MYREIPSLGNLQLTRTCPVCGKAAHVKDDEPIGVLVICRICGKYRYDRTAEIVFQGISSASVNNEVYKISFRLRTMAERAFGKRDNSLYPMHNGNDFADMLKQPDLPIEEKATHLLRYLGSISEYPGQPVRFASASDYSVLDAKNPMEAEFHIRSLEERGYIARSPSVDGGTQAQLDARFGQEQGAVVTVTSHGWSEIDKSAESGSQSAFAFVAMSFDSRRRLYYEAIERAVQKAGYDPIRIDRVEHVNRIDDEIIAQIRRSKFMIADFTGQRGGVYFESGFMLGLGRQVVWLCDKSELHQVHFDTRQYNTIDYIDVSDLELRLQMRIEAIFGKGPHPTIS